MAEQLTPQQALAVRDRGGRLLVSAAAGSGKTKVLVDRLLSYLKDERDPADLDEFLMITYTKAAAAELRGKIAAKLTEYMAAEPENKHLQRQMQRLYLTKISTVHAFCADILREYAYRTDIPADFRVADENECRELRQTAVMTVLEQAYESLDADEDFRTFLDTQGLGRDDRLIPEILLKVYDSARCHLSPENWLEQCVSNSHVEGLEDAGQTIWGQFLMADLQAYLDLQIDAMEHCAAEAAISIGMEKPAALLRDTVFQLQYLRQSETWDEVCQRKSIDYGRLTFSKSCTDLQLADRIKAVRESCKKGLEKKLKSFSSTSEQTLADLAQCGVAIKGMVTLVRCLEKEYDRLKRQRHVLDFGDLEHRTLDLLLGIRREHTTAIAAEIGNRFREIMVDEYQDSNAVQDAIFSALTQNRNNCFMVGDVKQSIYQFRLADPTIFLEKYASYCPAEDAKPGEGRKVLLSANFRSSGGVLQGVNDIFTTCMSPAVGGLYYGEDEALREGMPHISLEEPEVELLALPVRESTYDEEPAVVAKRIEELLDGSHFVRQGETLRSIRPEDITILLRSPGSVGIHFVKALEERGIRCVSGGGDDLLQTQEIQVLHSLLQTISNPRQDIPLIATLASPLFCFTADELAQMRGGSRHGSIYDALKKFESSKAKYFLKTLDELRKTARLQTLPQLLEQIFIKTHMESIYAAMPGGDLHRANLQTFYSLVVEYDAAGRRDLSQFLDFLAAMEDKGLIAASDQSVSGAVTLMSIHKSKGLEFPVVFVCGLSREFNRESVRAQVLCDKELGLGLTAVDHHNRVRYPTVAKRAIAVKTTAESLSEEMRVLYVALTRARDRLIMTYASGNLESELQNLVLRMDMGRRELLTRDVVCPGQWVLLAALRRAEAGSFFALGGRPAQILVSDNPWKIQVAEPSVSGGAECEVQVYKMPEELPQKLKESLSFRYGHEAATIAPSKQTATQLKGREKDAEAAEKTYEPKQHHLSWRKPAFAGQSTDAVAYGNAMHACMQFIRYEACTDVVAVKQELEQLTKEGVLTNELVQMVDVEQIATFFQTELGEKLRHGESILREFKFSILDDGEKYDPFLIGEKILLQGVVDCALVESDGITVLDFKTDHVTEETLQERADLYRQQILAYAGALERIYQKPVKDYLLYFFRLGRFVKVSDSKG